MLAALLSLAIAQATPPHDCTVTLVLRADRVRATCAGPLHLVAIPVQGYTPMVGDEVDVFLPQPTVPRYYARPVTR